MTKDTRTLRKRADPAAQGPQSAALSLLLAEMQALSALMPGASDTPATEDEVEASFDNMPV